MLRPSKKLVLALEAVADIAFHGGTEPVQSQDIARRLCLPRRYLEQVMQQLVRAGILRGVRGPRGGYRLARERRRISVGDVVRVVRGIEDLPLQEDLASSSKLGRKVIGPFWATTEHELMTRLDRVSIADLCHRAEEHGVPSEGQQRERVVDYAV
jgi:Rrf2 family protein